MKPTLNRRWARPIRGRRGFTLIEVMIVVAIVAILAAIAYPSYTESVAKGRRAQAAGQLLAAHQWMERLYSESYRYDANSAGTATTNAALFPARFPQSPPPGEGPAVYTIALNPVAAQSYTITATRTGAMTGDRCGNLTINHRGDKSIVAGTFTGFADLAAAVQTCWRQ
jgi:type IV pilus assembly protein PilE